MYFIKPITFVRGEHLMRIVRSFYIFLEGALWWWEKDHEVHLKNNKLTQEKVQMSTTLKGSPHTFGNADFEAKFG